MADHMLCNVMVGEGGENDWFLISRTSFGGYIMLKLSRALI